LYFEIEREALEFLRQCEVRNRLVPFGRVR
jgi:hypothetical protein